MSYKHLTINERNKIEILSQEGYSSRRIAKILGFHHSTISRELNRCRGEYKADKAENDRIEKSSSRGRKSKASEEITDTITSRLNEKWSPEQIVGRLY